MFKTSRNRNSVKIVLDFTGFLRILGNNSAIPFLTAAEKRHFHPPKLPALRAEVDGRTQKSVRPFSCFAACGFSLCRKPPAGVLLLRLPFPQRSRTSAQRLVFCCWMGTRSAGLRKPHKPPTRARRRGGGVLSGFVLRSRISLHGDFQQLLCDLFVGETDQVIVGSFIGQQVHAAVPDEAAV